MKTKLLILGSTGLLGNAVGNYFLQNECYHTTLTYRKSDLKYGEHNIYFDALNTNINDLGLNKYDYVINCIGVIKPLVVPENEMNTVKLNSLFPHLLADECKKHGTKMIHITTDCVFSGKNKKAYTESSLHDCLDFYGKSKSLGEPKNCMVLRTSIIGEEMHSNISLIEWAKKQRGGIVNGYTHHLWNGVTTKQYANICEQIIQMDLYKEDLYHITSNTVNKYVLLQYINERFDLDLTINKYSDNNVVYRNLGSEKDLINKLNIKNLKEQILDL